MPLSIERVVPAPVPPQAREHRVRVRDGVHLATDVHLPGADGPAWPAVLIRLPYDKNSRYVFTDRIAQRLTARGYAVVVQDVRGKFRSEGETLPFVHESADGHDTIEWITRQPWSNGRVGMFGDSYYGFTQWAAVAAQHPALRAVVPRVTAADFNAMFRDGGRDLPPPPWREGIGYFAHHWVGRDTYEYLADPAARPAIAPYEQAFRQLGARSAWFTLLAPHRVDLCTQFGLHPFDARPVPVLHCVGWYDNIVRAHLADYRELAARPEWDAVQYLWAGAVDHENYRLDLAPVAPADDHAEDERALERMLDGYLGPAADFLDVFLKGSRPAADLPKVRWELGHAGWRTAPSWPPPGARPLTLRLTGAARAGGPLPGGGLVAEDAPGAVAPGAVAPGAVAPGAVAPGAVAPGAVAPAVDAPAVDAPAVDAPGAVAPAVDAPGAVAPGAATLPEGVPAEGEERAVWTHDPDAPVPSLVDNSFAYLQTHPDLAPLADRPDVLAFTGDPLDHPLDLAGPVGAELHVTADAPVFDVFARLADLAPDGTARLIVRGQVQATAGGLLHLDLAHTGYRLRAGHRLLLLVAASDFPLFLTATGTGDNPWTATEVRPAVHTLTSGGATPSRLTLTVLPAEAR
ncbi:CocE/NonD family hydrolase [Kitasatospora sp. NPDC088391]|uniref:CocE/NonD family hydrolase n=1 Tax=Kitasatospora sp. NPDC088391 TaxID=3364074 RepID=UPI0038117FE4